MKNKFYICPDCGMARDNNQPKPTETPKPIETSAPAVEAALLKLLPRVEFQQGECKSKIHLSYDNVIYAKDLHEDVHYHVGCLVENHGKEAREFTLTVEINDKSYSFSPTNVVAGDDHGFMVTSVKLEPGTYTVKWFMDGQLTNDYTVTVKDEYSATYEWVKSKIDVSLGLSIWDDAGERRVKDGISIGELSELADGQRYIPHMAVTNNDIKLQAQGRRQRADLLHQRYPRGSHHVRYPGRLIDTQKRLPAHDGQGAFSCQHWA